MKKSHILRRIIIGLVAVVILGTVGISGYVGYNLTHPIRETIDTTPQKVGLQFEDISFPSQLDKTTLRGWWIPAQTTPNQLTTSSKTVIFVHGYTSSRLVKAAGALPLSARLAHSGYNVLMFDLRGAGNSDGSTITLGQNEKYDVLSAINFAKMTKKSGHIALLGWSMGAATAIITGVQSSDVQGIIADSPFADLHDYIDTNLSYWSGLPRYPFTPVIFALTQVLGLQASTVSPYHAIANLGNRGLLLIHSCKDTAIPCTNSQQIYASISDKSHSELWLTERGDHVKSYIEYGPIYETKVLDFLAKYLR